MDATKTPLPFSEVLPALQTTWDSTSIGWLKTCPRMYQLQMIEGRSPKKMAETLRFGILYHKLHEVFDKAQAEMDFPEAQRFALRKVVPEAFDYTESYACLECDQERQPDSEFCPWCTSTTEAVPHKFAKPGIGIIDPRRGPEQLTRTFLWHTWQYKDTPPKVYVLPKGPALELSFKFQFLENSFGEEIFLSGHFDRIEEVDGDLWTVDHKTTTMALNSNYFNQWSPHNQMSLYTYASQIVFSAKSSGTIIDGAHINKYSSMFERGFVHRTPAQLEEWARGLEFLFAQAEIYAEANWWPMNEESCGKYGGCPFRGICSKDPAVRKNFLEADFIVRRWNPLEAR